MSDTPTMDDYLNETDDDDTDAAKDTRNPQRYVCLLDGAWDRCPHCDSLFPNTWRDHTPVECPECDPEGQQ
jgi:hypothetical protein